MMPSVAGDLSADATCIIFVTSLGAIALHKAFITYGQLKCMNIGCSEFLDFSKRLP